MKIEPGSVEVKAVCCALCGVPWRRYMPPPGVSDDIERCDSCLEGGNGQDLRPVTLPASSVAEVVRAVVEAADDAKLNDATIHASNDLCRSWKVWGTGISKARAHLLAALLPALTDHVPDERQVVYTQCAMCGTRWEADSDETCPNLRCHSRPRALPDDGGKGRG